MEISSLEGLLKKFHKKGVDFGIWGIVYTLLSHLDGKPDMFMAENYNNMNNSDFIRFPFGTYNEKEHRAGFLFVDDAERLETAPHPTHNGVGYRSRAGQQAPV